MATAPMPPMDPQVSHPKLPMIIAIGLTAIIFGLGGYMIASMANSDTASDATVTTGSTSTATTSATPTTKATATTTTSSSTDETKDWKTYTSTSQKFSFKYPSTYTAEKGKSSSILQPVVEQVDVSYPTDGLARGISFSVINDTLSEVTSPLKKSEYGFSQGTAKEFAGVTWQVYTYDPAKDKDGTDQGKATIYVAEYNGKVFRINGNTEAAGSLTATQVQKNFDLILSTFNFTK